MEAGAGVEGGGTEIRSMLTPGPYSSLYNQSWREREGGRGGEGRGGEGSTLAKLGSSPAGPGNLGLDRGVLIGVWIIGAWEASDIGGLFLGVVKTGVVLLLGVVIPVEGAELVVICFDGV